MVLCALDGVTWFVSLSERQFVKERSVSNGRKTAEPQSRTFEADGVLGVGSAVVKEEECSGNVHMFLMCVNGIFRDC